MEIKDIALWAGLAVIVYMFLNNKADTGVGITDRLKQLWNYFFPDNSAVKISDNVTELEAFKAAILLREYFKQQNLLGEDKAAINKLLGELAPLLINRE